MKTAAQPATNLDDADAGAVERITIPYTPRVEQRAYHASAARFKVLVAHRRLGKTVAAVNEGLKRLIQCPLDAAQGAYLAPFRNQAKRVAWGYVKQYTRPIPGVDYNESELTVNLPNGAKFSLYGGDNVHALRGVYLDHAVIDEPAQMHPLLWSQVLRPALSDRRGAGTFIGTPQGKNQFWRLYRDASELEGWERFCYPVSQTNIIHPDELMALRREMDEDSYRQEYECDFEAAIKGAFYGREMRALVARGQVSDVPHDPALPTSVAWDLGMADATVLTYWQVAPGGQVRCIDCDAHVATSLAEVVKVMRAKPYVIDDNWLPHDVKVRELGTGASRYDTLWDLGVRGTILPVRPVADGIDAVRALLPRTWFDQSRCADLVEALKTYRTEYSEERQVFSTRPLHTWESDYADSVRYFASSPGVGATGFGRQRQLLDELNADLDRSAV